MVRTVLLSALLCALLVAAVLGDCMDHGEGHVWQTGPPDQCAEYSCMNGHLKGKTCPTIMAPDTCKLKPMPAGAVFPDCCPQYECPP